MRALPRPWAKISGSFLHYHGGARSHTHTHTTQHRGGSQPAANTELACPTLCTTFPPRRTAEHETKTRGGVALDTPGESGRCQLESCRQNRRRRRGERNRNPYERARRDPQDRPEASTNCRSSSGQDAGTKTKPGQRQQRELAPIHAARSARRARNAQNLECRQRGRYRRATVVCSRSGSRCACAGKPRRLERGALFRGSDVLFREPFSRLQDRLAERFCGFAFCAVCLLSAAAPTAGEGERKFLFRALQSSRIRPPRATGGLDHEETSTERRESRILWSRVDTLSWWLLLGPPLPPGPNTQKKDADAEPQRRRRSAWGLGTVFMYSAAPPSSAE
ncbi:hypothetical protein HPB48_017353 [Haemaphysalis longicornis]|uniref:Uncharacterized protein n=1 Tax=Haemaphysalis longicornis TaxID=44386 RepID=A0A9J6GXF3_HAELO|nr:hypothetical protein HPB48_017353 [Haemaphysalis longicornis]